MKIILHTGECITVVDEKGSKVEIRAHNDGDGFGGPYMQVIPQEQGSFIDKVTCTRIHFQSNSVFVLGK